MKYLLNVQMMCVNDLDEYSSVCVRARACVRA